MWTQLTFEKHMVDKTAIGVVVSVLIQMAAAFAGTEDHYPKNSDWQPTNTGSENVSLFVFRDSNADGVHSPGELPLANIAVLVHRPDGSRILRRSNLYGFVNITKSATIPGVDITEEAEYRFEVIPPPGWRVTTDNLSQLANFQVAPQTRPGIVADQVPTPVGLLQKPTITGRILERSSTDDLSPASGIQLQFVSSGSGEVHEGTSDEAGVFSVQVGRGIMPTYPDGLHWTDLIVSRNTTYLGAGYINNSVTGGYIGYNSSGYPVTVSGETPFDFVGAYFGVGWSEADGETLTVKAWHDDELVHEESLSLSAMGPVWLDADFRAVTRVEFATKHYWQFVMDAPAFRLSK
jgi:hypothetical protein